VDLPPHELDRAFGDLAAVHGEQTGDRPHERRLAGAVRSEHRHDRVGRDLEADTSEHQQDVVVHDFEPLNAQD
jgi:hypothetical protein